MSFITAIERVVNWNRIYPFCHDYLSAITEQFRCWWRFLSTISTISMVSQVVAVKRRAHICDCTMFIGGGGWFKWEQHKKRQEQLTGQVISSATTVQPGDRKGRLYVCCMWFRDGNVFSGRLIGWTEKGTLGAAAVSQFKYKFQFAQNRFYPVWLR